MVLLSLVQNKIIGAGLYGCIEHKKGQKNRYAVSHMYPHTSSEIYGLTVKNKRDKPHIEKRDITVIGRVAGRVGKVI